MFDVTTIIQGLIVLLVAVVVYKLWPLFKTAVPAVVVKIVQVVARFAVYAVEAEFGSGNGEEKFDSALKRAQEWFSKYGMTFDTETIKSAIMDEWYKLNVEQIQTGIKKNE